MVRVPGIHNGERQALQQMVLGKLQTHHQRIALQLHLTPSTETKLDSKCITDLKENPETVKLLEAKWEQCHDIGLGVFIWK